MHAIHNKKIKLCFVYSVVPFCVILPDVGDIIAETSRTDRTFTCVFRLCEYVGVIYENQIFACLENEPSFLSESNDSCCMGVRAIHQSQQKIAL